MNKSVLWLIKTYFFFVFLDVLVAVAVVVAKAHSTRIRQFLNPQIFLCGFKNYHVHTQRIQIKFACPHVFWIHSLLNLFQKVRTDKERLGKSFFPPSPPPTHTQGSNSCPELFLNEVIQELDYVRLSYVRKFRGKISVKWYWYFLAPKTGTGLSCTIYKIPLNFSLSLDMKPVSSNPEKWYRKLRSFRQKREKVIPRKVLLFSRKISTGMNRSI